MTRDTFKTKGEPRISLNVDFQQLKEDEEVVRNALLADDDTVWAAWNRIAIVLEELEKAS